MNSPDVLIKTPIGTEYHLNNGLPVDGVVTEMSDKTLEVWSSKPGQPSPAIQRLTARINGLNKPIDLMKLCSERLAKAKNKVPSSAVQISPAAKAAARDYAEEWRQLDQAIIKQHRSKIGQPEAVSAKSAQTFQGEQVWQGSDQPNYEAELRQYLEGPITEGPTSGIYDRVLRETALETAPPYGLISLGPDTPPREQEPEPRPGTQVAYVVNIPVNFPRITAEELYQKTLKAREQSGIAAMERIRKLCSAIREIHDNRGKRLGIVEKQPDKEVVLSELRRILVDDGAKDSGEPITMKTPLSIIGTYIVHEIKKDLFKLLGLLQARIITGDEYEAVFEMTQMAEVKRVLGKIEEPED